MLLGLHYTTPASWAERVLADPGALLLDHLFCERKAAAMALHTMRAHGKRFPTLNKLMPDLANEEYEHAAQCERMLKNYPPAQPPDGGSAYAQGLRKLTQTRGRDTFMDMLLVCGVIESRSAERFRLLADRARGTTLGGFYEDLYASEVNHYLLFTNLASEFYSPERAQSRLHEIRVEESRLIQALPPGPRLH